MLFEEPVLSYPAEVDNFTLLTGVKHLSNLILSCGCESYGCNTVLGVPVHMQIPYGCFLVGIKLLSAHQHFLDSLTVLTYVEYQ